jgi:hypothetical protein
MKTIKLIKFLSVVGCAALAAACSDEFPKRETSPVGNENSMQVYFPAATNKAYHELETADDHVTIYMAREKSDEAAEIPLTVLRNDNNVFDVPATVGFGQGEAEIAVDIPFSGEEVATNYTLEIKIDGNAYVNPYKEANGVAHLAITIVKLQWEPFASGTFTSNFVTDVVIGMSGIFPCVLHKAVGTNKYRFFELYKPGYHFNFEWEDGEKNIAISPTDVSVKASGNVYYGQFTGHDMGDEYGYAKLYAYASTDPEVTYYEAEKDGQGEVIKERFVINSMFLFSYDGSLYYVGTSQWLDEIFEFTVREK